MVQNLGGVMLEIDTNRLLEDLYWTRNSFVSGANKDMIRYNYGNFILLNDVLGNISGKMFSQSYIFPNFDDVQQYVDTFQYKDRLSFIDFICTNQDLIHNVFTNYGKLLDEMDFRHLPFVEQVRRYSEKDFIDIILSYFSTYGDNYYKVAKKYFEEERVHMGYQPNGDTAGFFEGLKWLYSGYIISMYRDYNTWSAASFCHELGHAVDAETFIFPQQKVISTLQDMLLEVPSTTFELGFLDYLKKNKIDYKGSLIAFNDRCEFVRDCAKSYDVVYKADDAYIEPNGYVTLDDTEVFPIDKVIFNDDGTILVDNKYLCEEGTYQIDGDKVTVNKYKEYPFREDMLYGLGYYIAIHLNLIRDNSPEEFNKIFNNFITSRKEKSLEESIESLGISLEDFISGKYAKPKIEENYLALKKRFKVY